MIRYRNLAFSIAAMSVLFGSLLLSGTGTGQAQGKKSQDVFVVNTSSDPVPTLAQGTTQIAGSVAVTNTPMVNLTPGARIGIDSSANSVQLASSPANPIWVRDVDNARQPFQTGIALTVPAGTLGSVGTLTSVPTGKRLVIEYVSAHIDLPTGQRLVDLVLQSPPGTYSHYLTPTFAASSGALDIFFVSQQLRLYANPGELVLVGASRSNISGSADVTLTVSGYLIDVP